MFLHLYSNGKSIEDTKVTFDEAMYFVQNQQTIKEEPENFIGFTAPEDQDAVLQFVREEEDKWIVDVPVVNNDKFTGSFVTIADHNTVIAMVSNFFMVNSNLRQSIVKNNFDKMKEICADRWGLDYRYVDS